ncbi:pyruvate, phosphate dikinase [Citricoccus nitrophenolicus]
MTGAVRVLALRDALDPSVSGGKAAPLARLMRAGFAVPEGFVVPATAYRQAAAALGLNRLDAGEHPEARRRLLTSGLPAAVGDGVREGLVALGGSGELGALTDEADAAAVSVAVRSSAVGEDGAVSSGAGQHESVLDVRGEAAVGRAVLRCWASGWSERAVAYRTRDSERHGARPGGAEDPENDVGPVEMALLVQRYVDAEFSGVMFTGPSPGDPSVIEAARGPGERVVSGRITPDSWRVDHTGILDHRPGESREPCLRGAHVQALHALGMQVSAELGGPRDIEWALADGHLWILQARPVTAPVPAHVFTSAPATLPAPPPERAGGPGPAVVVPSPEVPASPVEPALRGVPASPGTASGRARVVNGPGDFTAVCPGDVLVCRETDPAWTPLFAFAAAVVTETGGVLSHAAIVAREVGIPAVLAVPRAADLLASGPTVMVDGDAGIVRR